MTYYLLLDGDTSKDVLYDANILGEESFGSFYVEKGMTAFNNIVNNKPELLDRVVIKNEHNKTLTITEFLDKLGTWKIAKNA